MKDIFRVILVGLLAFSCVPFAAHAQVEETYEDGKVVVQKYQNEESRPILKAGKSIRFEIPIYEGEFFGHPAIFANAHIANTSDQSVKAIYYISFYDSQDKMVGCHQGSWDLEAGEDIRYGSGIIFSTSDQIETVTSYRLRTLAGC